MAFPSQDEIIARYEARKDQDFLGFEVHEYLAALDKNRIGPFLKEDADASDWTPIYSTPDEVKAHLIDYLPFAWEKANNCRGISAGRSISHIIGWLWLMGGEDREFGEEVDRLYEDHYEHYGKAILVKVSERFDFDWKAEDNNRWVNDEMSDGIPADQALAAWSGQ